MRYPEEITLEIRNEEPDKKRRFAPASAFKTPSQTRTNPKLETAFSNFRRTP